MNRKVTRAINKPFGKYTTARKKKKGRFKAALIC